MPATLRYTWEETNDSITVKIPLKGKSKKYDVYCSDLVIKVSCVPFLLQLDLKDFIIPASLQSTKKNGDLIIRVSKVSKGLWTFLTFDGTKAEANERRNKSIDRRTIELQKLHEESLSRRREEERVSIKSQMALEKAEMQQIDRAKNREKKIAEDAMYESMSRLDYESSDHSGDKAAAAPPTLTVCPKASKETRQNTLPQKDLEAALSSTRAPAIVQFKHTPRAFKTPMRESTQLQEKAFLAKNRPYLKANRYFNSESSHLSDTDPTWLMHKGGQFVEADDYLSAINVYSMIIDKDPESLLAYAQRSLCFLSIEEPGQCIHDCSRALELMMSKNDFYLEVSEKIRLRGEILIRAASAHCQFDNLHHYKLALVHVKDAKRIAVDDKATNSLNIKIQQLDRFIEAYEYKRGGDIAFGSNKLEAAIELYNKAISTENDILKAYANRSATYFLVGKYERCIADCSLILEKLKSPSSVDFSRSNPFSIIPLPGTDCRKNLVQTCIQRRAMAYRNIGESSLSSNDDQLESRLFGEPNQ